MLKIWGRLSSINVRKVVFTAQHLGVPFTRVDAGAEFGIVATPGYLAMNPNALVPTLEDDGFRLWESNVVVRYLCAKHSPGGLYPEALRERFDAERWMDWQQTTLNRAGREAFLQLVRTPAERRDAKAVERSISDTEPLLDLLDGHLARQRFMAGDRLTMADIPLAMELHRWRGTPVPRHARRHLDAWYEGIAALPAARGILDMELT